MSWIYKQSTGELFHNEQFIIKGYSGFGEGKNNPSMQMNKGIGPIPQGKYIVGPPFQHPQVGPYALRLTPTMETQTFGRSGFLIHGDSIEHPGEASHGCIILPRNIREQIFLSNDHEILVHE